ncbi:MAG: hypothetical protein VKN72_22815 [Nostocales cyanobacterium 94392]|nr:hypothetical protein [Nostocales cyanobacterium 94392]
MSAIMLWIWLAREVTLIFLIVSFTDVMAIASSERNQFRITKNNIIYQVVIRLCQEYNMNNINKEIDRVLSSRKLLT